MMTEAFERRTLSCLRAQAERYPAMQAEDIVKYVFQAMLGVGHLLTSREAAAAYIAREMAGLDADPQESLTEPLGPAWCRLNLRRALAEGLAPDDIAGLMTVPRTAVPFTRADVRACCLRLADSLPPGMQVPDEAALAAILDETWLPNHSDAYRALYRPAYRVIAADWIPCLEAVLALAALRKNQRRTLVTLDGPCATGKTTLAGRLAEVFGAAVVHTDDFVIPHAQKTPERLAIPGGNCDADRLAAEVTAPWKAGAPVRYRIYDFRSDRLKEAQTLPDTDVLILEGSYCNLPAIRRDADLRLFLDAPTDLRLGRLRQRESPASLVRFLALWIPLEDAYFSAYGLPDGGMCVISAHYEDADT